MRQVAPVDYGNTFIYRDKIYKFVNDHKNEIGPLKTYNIFVNDGVNAEEILKPYPTRIYKLDRKANRKQCVDEVKDIYVDIIRDDDDKAVAWIWFSISNFVGQINKIGNMMRGLRIRHHNIEIGDEQTCITFNYFKEDRGSGYFFGEIHVIDHNLRPNARRDYFDKSPYLVMFERAVKSYIHDNLDSLYRAASNLNSRYNDIEKYNNAKQKMNDVAESKDRFISPKEELDLKKDIENLKKKAEIAEKAIITIKKNASDKEGSAYAQMVQTITNSKETKRKEEECEKNLRKDDEGTVPKIKKNKRTFLVDELSSLDKKERKLVTKIYEIIRDNLSPDESQDLIKKIQEGLK